MSNKFKTVICWDEKQEKGEGHDIYRPLSSFCEEQEQDSKQKEEEYETLLGIFFSPQRLEVMRSLLA